MANLFAPIGDCPNRFPLYNLFWEPKEVHDFMYCVTANNNKHISPLIMWTAVIITYLGIWCHEIKCCNMKSEFSCLCKLPNTCSNTYQVFSGYICGFSHDFFTENKNKLQLWVNNLETLGTVRVFWHKHPCFWRTGI